MTNKLAPAAIYAGAAKTNWKNVGEIYIQNSKIISEPNQSNYFRLGLESIGNDGIEQNTQSKSVIIIV